jgi:hypothetical protein
MLPTRRFSQYAAEAGLDAATDEFCETPPSRPTSSFLTDDSCRDAK